MTSEQSVSVLVLECSLSDGQMYSRLAALHGRFPKFHFQMILTTYTSERRQAIKVYLPLDQIDEVQTFAWTLLKTPS